MIGRTVMSPRDGLRPRWSYVGGRRTGTTTTVRLTPKWWQFWRRFKRWREDRALVGEGVEINGQWFMIEKQLTSNSHTEPLIAHARERSVKNPPLSMKRGCRMVGDSIRIKGQRASWTPHAYRCGYGLDSIRGTDLVIIGVVVGLSLDSVSDGALTGGQFRKNWCIFLGKSGVEKWLRYAVGSLKTRGLPFLVLVWFFAINGRIGMKERQVVTFPSNTKPGDFLVVGRRVYGRCVWCSQLVQVNKMFLGSLHFCLTDEEKEARR